MEGVKRSILFVVGGVAWCWGVVRVEGGGWRGPFGMLESGSDVPL